MPNASDLRPDEALIARFRRDLEALTGEAPTPARKLGLGVSGGPDSLAMLLLAAAAYPGAVCAATVDHGLRPEARDEAAMVTGVCARLGVEHAVLGGAGESRFAGNLQEQARLLRYTLLRDWATAREFPYARPWRAEHVATAHHIDDVAETFLMRARRGAGVGGLSAMVAARAITPPFVPVPLLVRPLLGWRRAELEAIVGAAGLTAVSDPSNVHPRFDRSRIRALLASSPELPPDRIAQAARNLRVAEEALQWTAAREWDARHSIIGFYETVTVEVEGLPYELRRRLAHKAIEEIRFELGVGGNWRGTGLDRLVATLDSGGTGTIAGVQARAKQGKWHFRPAPPRRSH